MASLNFERTEYAKRLAAVKKRMTAEGMDVLVVTEPSNMNYLTGYDAYSFYVVQAVVVALDSELPIWTGRFMDAVSAHSTTYLPADHIIPYTDHYVQSTERHPMDFIGRMMAEKGWGKATIGVEMGAYYYTARSHAQLQKALPNARFEDAELLVNWVRIVKSEQELDYMRAAGATTDLMVEAAKNAARPDIRECDLASAIVAVQLKGTEKFGGMPSSGAPLISAGPRANEPHPAWNDKLLGNDIPINIEMAGVCRRYHCPISRTFYLGKPAQDYRDFADRVVAGTEAALGVVKPGTTCEEVEAAWRASLAKAGIEKEARLGYPTGIAYAPTWGERTASLRKGDKTVLEQGMVFHVMAGIWIGETGVTITQTFNTTATGYEALTKSPRELIVID
ncbi:MAG: Xaa-Pro peptidase family protein [Proteobacteria bacterium]|nr:Xaa-Pro peptidase family protein [Pseudomonadota bacterium]